MNWKRPMDQDVPSRKTSWKSINTFDYHNIDKEKNIFNCPHENWMVLHLNKNESPSSKNVLFQVWMQLVQWFLRRRFLNFVIVLSLFRNFLPRKRAGPLLEQICVPFTWGCFVTSLLEIGRVVLKEKIFFYFVPVFSLFSNYLPNWKREGPFI